MKYFHKNRLLKLADLLDNIPKKKFNLREWATVIGSEIHADTSQIKECGFAGCAVGWATTIPSFNRAGLRPIRNAARYVVKGRGYYGWEAPMMFFGVDGDDANYLFSMDYYDRGSKTTPKTVARRIRHYVRHAT